MDLAEVEKTLTAPDFDVERHASKVIESDADVAAYVARLCAAEDELDRRIQDQVSSHYEDLISQATGVERLEAHLETMREHSQTLLVSAERVRARVSEPHAALTVQTRTLARMQETCDLLRRIIRSLQLGKRLQGQLQQSSGSGGGSNGAGGADISKAALSLHELGELWVSEMDGVDAVDQDQRLILHAKADVERAADGMLARGMENHNQSQIGVAIQVFRNLGILEEKLDAVLVSRTEVMRQRFKEALDVKRGGTANSATSSMASLRASLWNSIEALLDFVFAQCAEVICLTQVTHKKRDGVTHLSFFELLGKKSLFDRFYTDLVSTVDQSLSSATAESSFLRQVLEGEFPKLLRLFHDLWSRMHSVNTDEKDSLASATMDSGLRRTLAGLERAYLSRSLSRLFDPVNLMFSSGEVPNEAELRQVFRGITSELNVAAQADSGLTAQVARNVAKTVRLMCVKCEQLLVTDGDASQVVGYPTDAQKQNVAIINCLSQFREGIDKIVDDGAVAEALVEVDKQIRAGLEPLLTSMRDAVDAILLSIHKEDFQAPDQDHVVSPYMRELESFVSKVASDYLSDFASTQDSLSGSLAEHLVEQFLIQASLVRPINDSGRRRLVRDADKLETSVLKQLLGHSDSSSLKNFRQMLLAKPEEMQEILKSSPSLSVSALHVLFSYGPPELKSPHESAGWSLSRYCSWLEDHKDESERLQLIQGTLESYVAATRARQEKAYAYPYTIMLAILEKRKKL